MPTFVFSTIQPVLIACGLLLGMTLLFRRWGNASVLRGFDRLSHFLLSRGLFSASIEAEATKIDLLRIITGLIFLHRTFYTALYVFSSGDDISIKIASLIVLALGICFTIGFFTPVVALILLFGNVLVIDRIFSTYTLGSDVLAMLLLTFAFAPSGTRLSVDAVLARGSVGLSRLIRRTYDAFGAPTVERLALVKWTTLLSYSIICLYSLLRHLDEPLWLSGNVGALVLSNSYLSRYPGLFQSLAESSDLFVWLTRMTMWGMLVWYVVFLPFILIGGWFRRAVILWSLLFFLASRFILQLGWLPYYEFVMLALLFWDRRFIVWPENARLEVLYDDRCNLCDRTVRFLSRADIFRALRFCPLTRNQDLVDRLGLSASDVLDDLHAYDGQSGRIFRGYDLYAEISKRLVLLLWLAPVFVFGRILGVGPQIYRRIARRRIEWFGVCERAPDYNAARDLPVPIAAPHPGARTPQALLAAFLTLHAALAAFFVVSIPSFGLVTQPAWLQRVTHAYAVMPIDVFNRPDLTLGEHWFTVEAVDRNGVATLIPHTAPTGERLDWHMSDRVFYGNSLGWRRRQMGTKEACYKPQDELFLADIRRWYLASSGQPPAQYRVSYYYQPLPTFSESDGTFQPTSAVSVCKALIDQDGKLVGVTDSRAATASN